MWEENPALKDILCETSPVQRDQRFDFQPPLQNFEKRALAESNQANLIKSTTGGNIEKNQSLETYTSGRDDEPNTEGGEADVSDSLTQVDRLFMTAIGQTEQITYSSEQQQQLMDSDCDRLINEGKAAITRAEAKCRGCLTRDNYPSTRSLRRREGRVKYTFMGNSPADPKPQVLDARAVQPTGASRNPITSQAERASQVNDPSMVYVNPDKTLHTLGGRDDRR